jgi:hypothetical protein
MALGTQAATQSLIFSPSSSALSLNQAIRGGLEDNVATAMAETVVDVLETVEVDRQQRERCSTALGGEDRLVDAVIQQHSVGQPGERVVQHLVEQRLALDLELESQVGHPLVKGTRHLDQPGVGARPHGTHGAGHDLARRVQPPGLLLDQLQDGVAPDQVRAYDVDDAELLRRGQVAPLADVRRLGAQGEGHAEGASGFGGCSAFHQARANRRTIGGWLRLHSPAIVRWLPMGARLGGGSVTPRDKVLRESIAAVAGPYTAALRERAIEDYRRLSFPTLKHPRKGQRRVRPGSRIRSDGGVIIRASAHPTPNLQTRSIPARH